MKVLLFALLLFSVGISIQCLADLKEFQLKRPDSSKINLYINSPSNVKSYPYTLFLQGSECLSIFSRPSLPISLADQYKTALVFVEKYEITKNQNDLSDDQKNCTSEFRKGNTIDQRISDYLQVVQALRSNIISKIESDKNWNGSIYIVGASEGAFLAPILAFHVPETKKILALSGGLGWTMREELSLSIKQAAEKQGQSKEQINNIMKEIEFTFSDIINNSKSEKLWMGHSYKWWYSILDVRALDYLERLSIPILMVHGTSDLSVPVESARTAKLKFEQLNKSNLIYWELDGFDHGYVDASGISHKNEVVVKSLDWLFGN
jgi:predicted peptidase